MPRLDAAHLLKKCESNMPNHSAEITVVMSLRKG